MALPATKESTMTHTRAEIGTEIELHSASALAQLQLQRLQLSLIHI